MSSTNGVHRIQKRLDEISRLLVPDRLRIERSGRWIRLRWGERTVKVIPAKLWDSL